MVDFKFPIGELLYAESEPESNPPDQESTEQTDSEAQKEGGDPQKVFGVHKTPSDPKVSGVHKTPSDLKVSGIHKTPSDLKVSGVHKTPSDLKVSSDPNVSSDLKVSSDPKLSGDETAAGQQDELTTVPVCTSQMFFFQLRSFRTLDVYWEHRENTSRPESAFDSRQQTAGFNGLQVSRCTGDQF